MGRDLRRRRCSRGRSVVGAAAALLAAGCGSDFGAEPGGTAESHRMLDLWRGTFLTAAVVGAITAGLILWSVVRYRRRRDADDSLPDQRQYHVPLEVLYTVVPVLIVVVLFAFSYSTQRRVDRVSPDPDVVVRVDGFQWQWQFRYPRQGITVIGTSTKPVLVLPEHRRIRFELVSHDVVHSFFVPGWLFKRDVIPGVENVFEVETTATGHFVGRCAEFCGLDHARMLFDVSVVPPAEYEAWVARHRVGAAGATTPTTSTTTTTTGPAR